MWALEQLPGSSFAERSGDAVDFYHRWKEDIDLLKSLGLNAFRFGIEWARVEPVPRRVLGRPSSPTTGGSSTTASRRASSPS